MESYPLLPPAAMAGVLDYRGRPITKSGTGRWTAASFILGMEIAERIAYNGIVFNLISYMTGPLGISTAPAAAAVSFWYGFAQIVPVLGAIIADSFLCRYRTIVFSSVIYILALSLLTLSAAIPNGSRCSMTDAFCPPSAFRMGLFYFSLYLVALAQGGHRPCVQAFGADQFDEGDMEESISKSSFFNWWFFALGIALTASPFVLSYVQDNANWAVGFGIPCIIMILALITFLRRSRTYRCYPLKEPTLFSRVGRALASLAKGQMFARSEEELDQLLVDSSSKPKGEDDEADEAKGLLRLLPIWSTCLVFAIVYSQEITFFTKQGVTLNRTMGLSFTISAAALQSISNVTLTLFVPVYDRLFVPLTRKLSGVPSGITLLQRIGTGLLLSVFAMVIAAAVEMKRLQTAREFGLVDDPKTTLPMSILWLFPQYITLGFADLFTMIGLLEFFYDQMPDGFRSLGIAIGLSIFGVGNFINGLLIQVIDYGTRSFGGECWFSDNINRARLDCFYLLVAALSFLSLIVFLCFSRGFVYKKKNKMEIAV